MTDLGIGDWSKLGSAIKEQRQRLELSQAEAAERAHVSRSWLARVEAGHRGAELEQLLRLLDALGLSLFLRRLGPTPRRTGEAAQELSGQHRETAASRRLAWGIPGRPQAHHD